MGGGGGGQLALSQESTKTPPNNRGTWHLLRSVSVGNSGDILYRQVPLALAFRSATHNTIIFLNLGIKNCVAMKQISPSHGYCTDMCLHSSY